MKTKNKTPAKILLVAGDLKVELQGTLKDITWRKKSFTARLTLEKPSEIPSPSQELSSIAANNARKIKEDLEKQKPTGN